MMNPIICSHCNAPNPFYKHICTSCKSYLRERVVNIDLWHIISILIENPVKAFTQIIYSEHKNFVFFIIFFASIKFLLDSVFISLTMRTDGVLRNFFLYCVIFFAAVTLLVYMFSLLLNIINKTLDLATRTRDNLGILSYSLLPHAFALLIIFPIELILFGEYLFSYSPSPFMIKPLLAYVLLGFELLVIGWSVFLSIMAMYTQSKNIIYSLITGMVFNFILFTFIYLFSLLILG